MSEEKKKESEAKPDDGKAKKKGLPALLFVVVGAILGGAGTVVALPKKSVEVKVEPPPLQFITLQHPDNMEFQFNPRTQAGRAYASVVFTFVYRVREDREDDSFESIKANWDRARSNVLLMLRSRSMTELNAENGQKILTKDLTDELDAALFPGKKSEKVAQVTEILWSKWMVQ